MSLKNFQWMSRSSFRRLSAKCSLILHTSANILFSDFVLAWSVRKIDRLGTGSDPRASRSSIFSVVNPKSRLSIETTIYLLRSPHLPLPFPLRIIESRFFHEPLCWTQIWTVVLLHSKRHIKRHTCWTVKYYLPSEHSHLHVCSKDNAVFLSASRYALPCV